VYNWKVAAAAQAASGEKKETKVEAEKQVKI
jgi:hypothetical protein